METASKPTRFAELYRVRLPRGSGHGHYTRRGLGLGTSEALRVWLCGYMHMESAMIASTVSQFESPSPKEMQGVAKRRFKGAGVGRRPTRRDNQRESDFELRDGLITRTVYSCRS